MTEPTTPTGQRLLEPIFENMVGSAWDEDLFEAGPEDFRKAICAIEAEAAAMERERLRARYATVRSEKAGPYVYDKADTITVALMDLVIEAILADHSDG